MTTLANPRKIIGSYAPPAKQTSYFGMPAKLNDYETDPAKLGDTTTLGGALGGLAKAGTNLLVNAGVRGYNAIAATGTPTTTFEERNAAFPAQNVKRYEPQGVRSVAPPARPAPQMLPAHTPGSVVAPATPQGVRAAVPQAPAPAPRPVSGGVRRSATAAPAWSPAPAGYTEEAAPAEQAMPEAQPNPMIRELPVEGAQFDAQSAVIPGANGGFGLTRNADGTVNQMFTLRERTPEEDAANPRVTQEAPVAGIRLRPGDVGYTGSQQAWEDQQATSQLLSNPFPFKTAAALLAQRAQGETEANNLRTFGLNAAQTAANVQHMGTEDQKISAEVPWIAPQAQAGIRQTLASANNLTASAGKTAAEIPYVGPQAEADIAYKKDLGLGVRSGAAIAQATAPWTIENIKSEIGLRKKQGEALPDKNQIAADTNATRQRAQDEVEMKTYAANDADFLPKFGAVGSSLPRYKASELIAQHYGLTYKNKPFKSGLIGMRTDHKPGWYTADGQEVPMDKMVEEYIKNQGAK